ncbi:MULTISPECIES: NACHT domain-containing protein [unclassified Saccharothrix]|uniref:NACHT domain-containing protein n=1 Tax=unclassified Saccharothrix TaxID=2593673 RepID=UPI00307D227B
MGTPRSKTARNELTFDGLCRLLKSASTDSKLLDNLDTLSGALLVLAPVAVGAPSLLPLLGAKNELVKAGKHVVRTLAKRPADDKLTRHDLLLTAYCLTCYTAFFEAVHRMLPGLRERLGLTDADRLALTNRAVRGLGGPAGADDVSALARYQIALPHPNDLVEHTANQLDPLYARMTAAFEVLVRQLAVWDEADETERDHVLAAIRELPDVAKKLYRTQYQALCVEFNEFYVWANLQEHAITRRNLDQVATDVKAVLELLSARPAGVDIGLAGLGDALARALPREDNLDETLAGLGRAYREALDEPIIDDTHSGDGVDLRYPAKADIFVPQAFRSLRYTRDVGPLENEDLWSRLDVRHDIGRYVLAHLSSPYSLEAPLVVLGQPGSGKSLLTEVLAGRLAGGEYHPVRVELRDINPDSDIQTQIEEQIRADTGREANWAELSSRCGDRPPLVVLDGYDELLQASGKVFSTYLMAVAAFQKRERVQGRTVRVIVTSRVTLIDKAEIPAGSTVVRLEEFDAARQAEWIDIWNRANDPYFTAHDTKPFHLPDDDNIRTLAGQPLLLLMLALYDSDRNRLAQQGSLDRTVLYHGLLTRFITRERLKGEDGKLFRALHVEERGRLVDTDLRRLAVAAVGMFNRRSLHITKSDLDGDIGYFGLHRAAASTPGPELGQAELLLGSFFFVHESRSRLRAGTGGQAAFEFLHNTFGEFLAAHWLMETVLGETETVRHLSANPGLGHMLDRHLGTLPDHWYTTLMATPLYSRPVVLEMLREWSAHRLAAAGRTPEGFTTDLERICYRQLGLWQEDAAVPDMLLGTRKTPFPPNSPITNLATYTLNLVVLRCIVGGPFEVDWSRLGGKWTNLTDLWRAGLGRNNLTGVSTVLSAQVRPGGLRLEARPKLGQLSPAGYLTARYDLAQAIGDDELAALAGWALQDANPFDPPPLEELAKLPTIGGSALHDEIHARAELRAWRVHGTRPSNVRPKHSTASSLLLDFLTTATALHFELFTRVDPDLATRLWHTPPAVRRFDSASDAEAHRWVEELPAITADVIADRREKGFARLDDESPRDLWVKALSKAALRVVDAAPATLHPEIGYELIASEQAPSSLVHRLLGPEADPWTIARRPRSTLVRLIELSSQWGTWGWVVTTLRALDESDDRTRLVADFGAVGTMVLLRAGGRTAEREAGALLSLDLLGIVDWCFTVVSAEEQRLAVEECLKLVDEAPASWLRIVGITFPDGRHWVWELAEQFKGELSVSATAVLERLREREEGGPAAG